MTRFVLTQVALLGVCFLACIPKNTSSNGQVFLLSGQPVLVVVITNQINEVVFSGMPHAQPIALPSGFYRLKASCPEYLELTMGFHLAPLESKRLKLDLLPNIGTVVFLVTPTDGRIKITTSDGRVVYDGFAQAEIPLPSGNYTARISKQGFVNETRKINMRPGAREEFSVVLKQAPGKLVTRSPYPVSRLLIPPGASRSRNLGTADTLELELVQGNYRMTFSKPGYDSQEKAFPVDPGRVTDLGLVILKRITAGRLDIRSDPIGADVFLAGKVSHPVKLGTTPLNMEMEAGTYHLTLSKPDACTVKIRKKVTVVVGNTTHLNFRLDSRLFLFRSTPTGATVSIDGKPMGQTPLALCNLSRGLHRVTARKGDLVCRRVVGLDPSVGGRIELRPTPVPRPDACRFVRVPAGEFIMGANLGGLEERPAHSVYTGEYWIGRYEITVAEYGACVQVGACKQPGSGRNCNGGRKEKDQHPINCISWWDARDYAVWISREQGIVYRLPTEAEWERAAGGDMGNAYPWGMEWAAKANFCDASCPFDWKDPKLNDGFRATAPTGSFPEGASPFGVEDLAGNVSEWVIDTFASDFYADSPREDPVNENPQGRKVIRGGAWDMFPKNLKTTVRHHLSADKGRDNVGFRLVSPTEDNIPECRLSTNDRND